MENLPQAIIDLMLIVFGAAGLFGVLAWLEEWFLKNHTRHYHISQYYINERKERAKRMAKRKR